MPELTDIAPGLYERINAIFTSRLEKDKKIEKVAQKIVDGTATHVDTQTYAILLGEHAASALREVLTPGALPEGRLWFNIAERTVRPVLENNRTLVNTVAAYVQESLNKAAGIGIKPVTPKENTDRIDGIIDKLANSELLEDVDWVLDEPVKNCTQSFADDFVRANFELQSRAGLRPRIVRTVYGKCCKWCQDLAGSYDYENAPADIYRRHERCRCIVTFEPSRLKQNVHTKKWYDQNGAAVSQRVALAEEKKRKEAAARISRIRDYEAGG